MSQNFSNQFDIENQNLFAPSPTTVFKNQKYISQQNIENQFLNKMEKFIQNDLVEENLPYDILNLEIEQDYQEIKEEQTISNQSNNNMHISSEIHFQLAGNTESQFQFNLQNSQNHVSTEQNQSIDEEYVALSMKNTSKQQKKNNSSKNIEVTKKINKKSSIRKEKTIEYVQNIVSQWRELYNSKKSLNEAAIIVGIPKKTLDDYFMQIKKAQNQNFQFDKYKKEKIGFLRSFVKQNTANSIENQEE